MKVRFAGSHVIEISKTIDNNLANGESIGLRLFRKSGVEAFRAALDEAMTHPDARKAFFVKAIQLMIDKGFHVGYADVTEFQYGELDFPEDLRNLEQSFSLYMIQNIYTYASPMAARRRPNAAPRSLYMKRTG